MSGKAQTLLGRLFLKGTCLPQAHLRAGAGAACASKGRPRSQCWGAFAFKQAQRGNAG